MNPIDHDCPACGAGAGHFCVSRKGGARASLCQARQALANSERRYNSELTDIGEQLVIPGCERGRARPLAQLDLWG